MLDNARTWEYQTRRKLSDTIYHKYRGRLQSMEKKWNYFWRIPFDKHEKNDRSRSVQDQQASVLEDYYAWKAVNVKKIFAKKPLFKSLK